MSLSNSQLNCTIVLDDVWDCATPKHQLVEYYRNGKIDSCRGVYSDMTKCLKAKTKPLEEAREMLKGSRLDLDAEDKPSPTSTIWKFKEQPGWK